ncbi:hypothetical protein RvVAT039_pl12600 (plasmid) [Agrobacterium vitis]|uniref:hypothetical protein n=1 Tax=Agrobacterium vitis TaxID=373 RepID=UPI0015D8CC6E|nr:hypothetical protein [Agrobacterium vitis]BCH62693.1 hypothetical protein RvVAR0630_pl08350 [Agrobacterium vitis]BCH68427.1 hypothetical protein RvVAT039_pl12600 [Agrobacterium vitis]
MPDIAHIATSFAIDPMAALLVAIPLSLALIVPCERLWSIHAPCALVLLVVSALFQAERHLALDSYLVGFFAFAAVCRDIPNRPLLYRVGILWFAAFSLIAAVIYAASDRTDPHAIEAKISHRPIPQ